MSYASRVYRQRNPRQEKGDKEGFFKKQPDRNKSEKPGAVIQPKVEVNKPGDKYEREADAVANRVVNQRAQGQAVQKKDVSDVQRAAVPEEKKKEGVQRAATEKKKDKDVQRALAPGEKKDKEVQRATEPEKKKDKDVQRALAPDEEKDKDIQRATDEKEDKDVQRAMAPEEKKDKDVQRAIDEREKPEDVQKQAGELKEDEDKTGVQAKRDADATHKGTFDSRLEKSSGRGMKMEPEVLHDMNRAFDADFSHVRIHLDNEAAAMNKDIQAQAFTHGRDIYFNDGKYNPASGEGKRLLAHELTHTIQQGGKVPNSSTPASTVQSQTMPERDLQSARFAGDEKLEETLDDKRHIKWGADGEHVKKLQQAMIDSGIPMPISTRKTSSPDGIFQNETYEAVKAFQRQCGLTARDVDGIVGPITMGLFDARFAALPGTKAPASKKKVTVNITRLFGSNFEPGRSLAYANTIYKHQANIEIVRGRDVTLNQRETESLIGKDQMLEMHFFGASADEKALFKVNQTVDEISVYFVKEISDRDNVISREALAYAVTAHDKLGIIGIGHGNHAKYNTLAHEIGHMLGVALHEGSDASLLMAIGAPGLRLSADGIKTMRGSNFAKDA
jgi:peptidoglycan hydrolase-like protein with peptidoglycan-binding domain